MPENICFFSTLFVNFENFIIPTFWYTTLDHLSNLIEASQRYKLLYEIEENQETICLTFHDPFNRSFWLMQKLIINVKRFLKIRKIVQDN